MKNIVAALLVLVASSAFADGCLPTEKQLVVTDKVYGAVNPSVYGEMDYHMMSYDTDKVKVLMDRGLVVEIPGKTVVCQMTNDEQNYRLRVKMAGYAAPLWIADNLTQPVH